MPPRKDVVTHKQLWGRVAALKAVASLHGAVFPDDNPEKRAARKAKAILHPEAFDTTYLPHYFESAPAPFHSVLYEIVSTVRLAAVEAARGHAKTTVITFAFSLKQLATSAVVQAWNNGTLAATDALLHAAIQAALVAEGRAPDERLLHDPFIVIDSCTLPQAEDIVASIKVELEQNQLLLGDWGELVDDVGQNYTDFVTRAGDRLLAVGFNVSRRGVKHRQWRPTLWICDDPDDKKTIGSEKVRRDQMKHVTGMVRPAMDPNRGRVFVIANETHVECVVATIYRDQEKPKNEQKFGAWSKYRFNAITDDDQVLWEARFTRAFLEELRAEDEEAFETEYMNNPPSGKEKPFPTLHYYNREDYPGRLPTVGALDPSLGKSSGSDFQALVFLRWSPKGNKILVHRAEFFRLPPPDLVATVNKAYGEEDPDTFFLEAIGFQILLESMMVAEGAASGLFPAFETIESQTESKEARITSLAPLVRNGTILFPSDGSCRQLERQFLAYPEGKKDGPDAVEMACRGIRRIARGSGVSDIRHRPGRRAEWFGRGPQDGRRRAADQGGW